MSNSDEKDLLTRELRERSADVDGHPIGFDAVRQSARRIRRRRNIVTGAVAAVVASISLPTGLAVTTALNEPGGGEDDSLIATSPAPTPVGSVDLTTKGVPAGQSPRMPYLVPRGFVTPDGTKVEVGFNLTSVAPFEDGWIGHVYAGNGGAEIYTFDADGNRTGTGAQMAGESMVVAADGSRVAYTLVAEDGTQTLVDAPTSGAEPRTWEFAARPAVEPVAFLDEDSLVIQQAAGGRPTYSTLDEGGEPRQLDGFLGVADAHDGLVAGITTEDMGSACSAVRRASTGETLWETCDYSLLGFSPDGRWIAATGPYQSGFGMVSGAILDAEDGTPMVDYVQATRTSQVTLADLVWEDDDSVLAPVMDGNSYGLLRLGLDGTLETTVEPIEAPAFEDWPLWLNR